MSSRVLPLAAAASVVALLSPPPATVRAASGLRASERAVLRLVNVQRRHRGLVGLDANRQLTLAARTHSASMVTRRFFAHVSPGGSTLVSRARAAGYVRGGRWRVGEAIAWGSGSLGSPRAVVAGWMRSPGHRRILLAAGYREAGVGVASGTPAGGPGVTVTFDAGRR
jgi:uncharacterized protein YkwD